MRRCNTCIPTAARRPPCSSAPSPPGTATAATTRRCCRAGMRPSWVTCRRSTIPPSTICCRARSEEHTSELQSPCNLVCRLLLEKKKNDRIADLGRARTHMALAQRPYDHVLDQRITRFLAHDTSRDGDAPDAVGHRIADPYGAPA